MTRFVPFASTIWTLIRSSKEDPRTVAGEVARLYRPPVVSYLRGRGVDSEQAEDLAQEVFLRIFEKRLLSKVEESRGKFRSFVLGVANNILREHRERTGAKKRGEGRVPIALDEEIPADGERSFTHAWMLHLLRLAMKALESEAARRDLEVFRSFVGCGPSYEELATQLGITTTAVRNALYRTKERLRAEVSKLINRYTITAEDFRDELAAFEAESAGSYEK